MQLMQPSPEKIDLMPPAMPPVIEERENEIADDGAASSSKRFRGKKSESKNEWVKHIAGKQDTADLNKVESDSPAPPAFDRRPITRRSNTFDSEHDQRG